MKTFYAEITLALKERKTDLTLIIANHNAKLEQGRRTENGTRNITEYILENKNIFVI